MCDTRSKRPLTSGLVSSLGVGLIVSWLSFFPGVVELDVPLVCLLRVPRLSGDCDEVWMLRNPSLVRSPLPRDRLSAPLMTVVSVTTVEAAVDVVGPAMLGTVVHMQNPANPLDTTYRERGVHAAGGENEAPKNLIRDGPDVRQEE